ncbi:MAG TPA: proton-conducting transporter membrane subunit [Thermoanaerobaculia bacterium]|nr:proton-conducting transporter membrane subunit [Thermoanaerobaculia bacterium]
MTAHLPILIVVLPLAGAVLAPVVGLVSERVLRGLTLGVLLLAQLSALAALGVALEGGPWRYELGGWAPPWGIEYVVDPLGGGMAVLVSFMALVTAIHAARRLGGATGFATGVHHALYLLLTAGLLGIVVTGDAFNLYVFLEMSALGAYALLAGGGDRAAVAVFRYLLLGTIAAAFYLLGIGHLYAVTGTLNLADLAARLPAADPGVVATALALIVVGLAIKIAIFPLHGWLPDAYTYAPTAMVSFVASVVSKVGAYVLLRFLFFVIEAPGATGRALDLLAAAAAIGIVAASVMAVAQDDLRRMLAYSSVAQMGYIVLGLGLGNATALTGALLHVVNHAVLKACLFMAAGNLLLQTGTARLAGCAGIARRLPLTMAAFAIAALSMIGLPPAGGFFSKWYLILGALEQGATLYVAAILAGSLLTAVYLFRVLERAYFRSPEQAATPPPPSVASLAARAGEAPRSMLLPVLLLALVVLGLGVFNQALVESVLRPALAGMGR